MEQAQIISWAIIWISGGLGPISPPDLGQIRAWARSGPGSHQRHGLGALSCLAARGPRANRGGQGIGYRVQSGCPVGRQANRGMAERAATWTKLGGLSLSCACACSAQ